MKKLLSLFLLGTVLLTLAACAGQTNKLTAAEPAGPSAEAAEQTAEAGEPETTKEPETSAEAQPETGSRILVAYFSATGTTRTAAETLAEAASADLYEIVPAQPYTADDLNYNDKNSRSTTEQNDDSVRPEISGSVENFEQYEVIFVGYPIWWGEEPRILDTFMENYDFSGKTVIPFCTSGGSGIGSSPANLEALTSGAVFLKGQRFDGTADLQTMVQWISQLPLNEQ